MSNSKPLGLQDILNQCEPLFGKKSTFEEAYPTIDKVEIEYTEDYIKSGYGRTSSQDAHHLSNKSSIGDFLRCSNPRCRRGGVRIGDALHNMVEKRLTLFEGSEECPGYEGSEKGRVKYKPCLNYFRYKIRVKYKAIA